MAWVTCSGSTGRGPSRCCASTASASATRTTPRRAPQEVLELIGDAEDVLGAAVDTGWWATQGYDPVQAIRDLRERLFHVHLKDVEAPGTHISCMHGEGVARIADCVDELLDSGLPGSADRRARAVRPRPDRRSASGCASCSRRGSAVEELAPCLTDRLRFAIVGCGNISGPYGETARAYPSVEIAGATDIDRALSAAFVERFGGIDYPSLDALLADPTIDAVVNLTSHGIHAQVTAAALEAGKHVHSEKPMAGSYAEARGLVELADANGVRLSCSPITFMGDAQEAAWSLLASGAIGTVRVVYAEANWGRIESWHPRPDAVLRGSGRWQTSASTRSRS